MADPSSTLPANLDTLLAINEDPNDIDDLVVVPTSGVDLGDKSDNGITGVVDVDCGQGLSLGYC